MSFDPSVVKPVLAVETLVQMPTAEFASFLFNYLLGTKGGTASVELYKRGEYDTAENICRQWINLCDAVVQRGLQLNSVVTPRLKFLQLGCLGDIQLYRGNYNAAESFYNEAICLAKQVNDNVGTDNLFLSKAVVYLQQGRYADTIEECEQAWEINEATHNLSKKRAAILTTMGCAYSGLGQHDKAISLHVQALEANEEEGKNSALLLNNLAANLIEIGEYEEAREILAEALENQSAIVDHMERVNILANIGKLDLLMSNWERSLKTYEEALAACTQHGLLWLRRGLRLNIGELLLIGCSEPNAALAYLEEALVESREARDFTRQVQALVYIGYAWDELYGDYPKAKEYYEQGATVLEQQRLLLGAEHFKISFAGENHYLYDRLISVCLKLNDFESALVWLEKSKAKALIDELLKRNSAESSLPPPGRGDPELRSLWREIRSARDALDDLYAKRSTHGIRGLKRFLNIPEESLEQTDQRILEAEARYVELLEKLQRKDPVAANHISVAELSIEQLRTTLDNSTTLIQLYQTEKTLFLFFVSRLNGVHCSALELRAQDAYDEVYAVLDALHNSQDHDVHSHEFLRSIKNPLAHLYDIFRAEFDKHLAHTDHLLFVPHSFWHFAPLHALYDRQKKKYLIDEFAISYVPASSMLTLDDSNQRNSDGIAAIFGDPAGDLPFASEEIERLRSLFVSRVETHAGSRASIQNLQDVSGRARFIHLATHGMFRLDNPMLSHIVLADETGQPTRLLAADILNLRFAASHITLSGCETGLLQVLPGDEAMGLARAFLVAGAESLLCSLWRVDDRSTAELMEGFYKGLLWGGLNKTKSLQQAIVALKEQPEYAHPFFWAPFIFLGT